MVARTGHCYLMMEDLQQAYAAYQQALYHLRDPKVFFEGTGIAIVLVMADERPGTEIVVWDWDTVRSLRISRARGRSFLSSHANAARF